MVSVLGPDGSIIEVVDEASQRFMLVVDEVGDVLKGNKNSMTWLGQKAAQLGEKNIADLLAPQSKMLATEIIVSAVSGLGLKEQPVFLYGAARLIKGFMMSGEPVANAEDDSVEFRLLFTYDVELSANSNGMNSAKGFANSVGDILKHSEKELDMTFVSVGNVENLATDLNLSDEEIKSFTEKLENRLKSESLEESALGEVSSGKYGLLHKADADLSHMKNDLQGMAKQIDPEGRAINIETKTLALDSESLADAELADALAHAVDSFVESGLDDLIYDNLSTAHTAFLDHKADRVQLLRDALSQDMLSVVYQPVVNVHEWKTDHLWAEFRADLETDGLSVAEIIKFTKDDFDLRSQVDAAQCKFIETDDWYRGCAIALTLHVRSLLRPEILTKLINFAATAGSKKVILRIAGFQPEDLEKLPALVSLKKVGFAIALYGEELGAISPDMLKSLPADYIILEDGFTESDSRLKASMPMLEVMERRCLAFNIKLVFDGIMSENTAQTLSSLRHGLAAGSYFGGHVENLEDLRYSI